MTTTEYSPLSMNAINPFKSDIAVDHSPSPPAYTAMPIDALDHKHEHKQKDQSYSPDVQVIREEAPHYTFEHGTPLSSRSSTLSPPNMPLFLSPAFRPMMLPRRGSEATDASDDDFVFNYDAHQIAIDMEQSGKTRKRTMPHQLAILEKHFEVDDKPDMGTRRHLGAQVNMTAREVQVWFQNRRAKVKKMAKQVGAAEARGEAIKTNIAPSRRKSQDIRLPPPTSFINPFGMGYPAIPPHLPHHSLLDMRRASLPAIPSAYTMNLPSPILPSFKGDPMWTESRGSLSTLQESQHSPMWSTGTHRSSEGVSASPVTPSSAGTPFSGRDNNQGTFNKPANLTRRHSTLSTSTAMHELAI